jgi:hypothetical protein
MTITATDTDGVLAAVTLGDHSSGDWIVDPPMLPSERRKVQVTPLFRGAAPFVWGRGNRTISFSWVVSRDHGAVATAAAFAWEHAGLVPINVSLALAEGAETTTYVGVISEVTCLELYGQATLFRYAVEGAVLQSS